MMEGHLLKPARVGHIPGAAPREQSRPLREMGGRNGTQDRERRKFGPVDPTRAGGRQ